MSVASVKTMGKKQNKKTTTDKTVAEWIVHHIVVTCPALYQTRQHGYRLGHLLKPKCTIGSDRKWKDGFYITWILSYAVFLAFFFKVIIISRHLFKYLSFLQPYTTQNGAIMKVREKGREFWDCESGAKSGGTALA